MLEMLRKEVELFPNLPNQDMYAMAKRFPRVFLHTDGSIENIDYPDGSTLTLDMCSGEVSARKTNKKLNQSTHL